MLKRTTVKATLANGSNVEQGTYDTADILSAEIEAGATVIRTEYKGKGCIWTVGRTCSSVDSARREHAAHASGYRTDRDWDRVSVQVVTAVAAL